MPFAIPLILLSCQNASEIITVQNKILTAEQKEYWYQGEAEISSFKIEQARYGEMRSGTAVMIFVTEDFSTKTFTKTEYTNVDKLSILKMNFTKNFNTGIYPYSLMTSTFVPFLENNHALKVSTSIQEWCGHVYMELIRKKKYYLQISSYFENESQENLSLPLVHLEDELWSKIRISPNELPVGDIQIIPAFTYLRFMHIDAASQPCNAMLQTSDSSSIYSLNYPDLERTVSISFQTNFPHEILSWEEEYFDGFGENKMRLKSTGTKIKMIKSSYWTKNKNSDSFYRKELGLE